MKYVIGLTGHIGTGKSTVLRILGELGAEIIDADRVAHDVMLPGGKAYLRVIEAFGDSIVQSDGRFDRKKLGAIVFSDAEKLHQLEGITHPAVEERIVEILQETPRAVVVLEAIKLIEAGLTKLCQEVWVVTSPRKLQLQRLAETRGMSRAEAERRINAQKPQAELVRAADVVINNAGTLDALRQILEAEWARVQQKLATPP